MKDVWEDLKGISGKARAQITKDYIGWPLVSALAMAAGDSVRAAAAREPGSLGTAKASRSSEAQNRALGARRS